MYENRRVRRTTRIFPCTERIAEFFRFSAFPVHNRNAEKLGPVLYNSWHLYFTYYVQYSIHIYYIMYPYGFPINVSVPRRNIINRFSTVLLCCTRFSEIIIKTYKRTEDGPDTDHHNVIPWNRILSHHMPPPGTASRPKTRRPSKIYYFFFFFPSVGWFFFFFARTTINTLGGHRGGGGGVNKRPPKLSKRFACSVTGSPNTDVPSGPAPAYALLPARFLSFHTVAGAVRGTTQTG